MVFSAIDIFALGVFLISWIGYTYFAKRKAKTSDCLARVLHQHRIHWMNELMLKDIRVGEAALLANLERNIAFFASSTLLVLAGVLALFSQVEQLIDVIESFVFASNTEHVAVQLKLSLLVLIFVFAFFQFTWSMRQYGFLNVMIGAAPHCHLPMTQAQIDYAKQMATVQDQAAHAYNYGLRAYYFSLAALCWFFQPVLFMFASLIVVFTLYHREFNSKAVRAITNGQKILNGIE